MSKIINIDLDMYDIIISYYEGDIGGASIVSNMKETPETDENETFNAAVDGIESVILAHFCAGIDVRSKAYKEGIDTAYQAVGNYYS